MVIHSKDPVYRNPVLSRSSIWTRFRTTPQWGGVAVIDQVVQSKRSSPSKAAASPILDNQLGCILNNWRSSRSQRQSIAAGFSTRATKGRIEIAPLPGTKRSAVLYPLWSRVRSTSSPSNRTATHRDSKGLWTIDGQRRLRRYVPADSLFGPQRAADLVRAISATDRLGPLFAGRADPYSHRRSRVLASTRRPRGQQRDCVCRICRRTVSDVDSFEQTDTITQFLAGETRLRHPLRRSRVKRLQRRRQSSSTGCWERHCDRDHDCVRRRDRSRSNTNKRHRWHRKTTARTLGSWDVSAHHGHNNTVCDSDIFSLLCDRDRTTIQCVMLD